MSLTVRENKFRKSRKSKSKKPTNTGVDNEITGFNNSFQNSGSNPNNPNASNAQNPNFKDCGCSFLTDEELQESVLKQLDALYNEAVTNLVALGYDYVVALKVVMRNVLLCVYG